MDDETIRSRLLEFSTCDVSDALLALGDPHGGFLADLILWSPSRQEGSTKIVGPAYTVKYERHQRIPGSEGPPGHYIDSIPPGSVVFISAPPNMVNAVYGGLMSHRAQVSGAVGTVVDGRVRDLDEHRELGYPVFARSVGTVAYSAVARVTEINTPVRLQSLDQDAVVHPGDFLMGDLNGVVCLPRAVAEQALALMGPRLEADKRTAEDISRGATFAGASKKHRATLAGPDTRTGAAS